MGALRFVFDVLVEKKCKTYSYTQDLEPKKLWSGQRGASPSAPSLPKYANALNVVFFSQ